MNTDESSVHCARRVAFLLPERHVVLCSNSGGTLPLLHGRFSEYRKSQLFFHYSFTFWRIHSFVISVKEVLFIPINIGQFKCQIFHELHLRTKENTSQLLVCLFSIHHVGKDWPFVIDIFKYSYWQFFRRLRTEFWLSGFLCLPKIIYIYICSSSYCSYCTSLQYKWINFLFIYGRPSYFHYLLKLNIFIQLEIQLCLVDSVLLRVDLFKLKTSSRDIVEALQWRVECKDRSLEFWILIIALLLGSRWKLTANPWHTSLWQDSAV